MIHMHLFHLAYFMHVLWVSNSPITTKASWFELLANQMVANAGRVAHLRQTSAIGCANNDGEAVQTAHNCMGAHTEKALKKVMHMLTVKAVLRKYKQLMSEYRIFIECVHLREVKSIKGASLANKNCSFA